MTKSDFLQLQELQRDSGLTLMKYLRENGLSYSTYNYWKRKFLCRESEESAVPFAYSGGYPFSISGDIRSLPS